MHTCAFLTLEDPGDFCIYDHLLIEPLARLGWQVDTIPWTQQNVDWVSYDAVVIRSTWDYQRDPEAFLRVLGEIESATRLFNPYSVCQWNLNKRYLQELDGKGVSIVPTSWLDGLGEAGIQAEFSRRGVPRIVAKPLVGANADHTYVLRLNDKESWVDALQVFESQPVMLQPFVDSVETGGEYSLFFFGGHYSHAILKQPATGDFRTQEEHGAHIRSAKPPEDTVAMATQALGAIGETLLYARIDLVRLVSGEVAVMEMELIEPSLYFDQCADATQRFARTLHAMAAM